MKYKILFWLMLTIAVVEGILLFTRLDLSSMGMAQYNFYDSNNREDNTSGQLYDSLVTADGSWISSQTDLAFPLSTLKIECWKEFGHCWIADASIMNFSGKYLSVGLNLKEIEYWNDDFIQTKPTKPALGCVEETYRLDRRSRTVTYTRKTIDSASKLCEDISEEPITATLGDGYKRIENYRKLKN